VYMSTAFGISGSELGYLHSLVMGVGNAALKSLVLLMMGIMMPETC
jgi:hypothetical protein